MATKPNTDEEIARTAEEIYRREIRDKVMPQHKGKFFSVNEVTMASC